jgi:hypothetical protein
LFWNLGAFFAVLPQKTGLSAPIFALSGQKFRFYPLRFSRRCGLLRGNKPTFPMLAGYYRELFDFTGQV